MARAWIALAAALLAAAALGAWWAARQSAGPPAAVEAPGGALAREAFEAPAAAPAPVLDETAREAAADQALLRAGRVVVPAGTPADERLVVVARSNRRFPGRPAATAREERVAVAADGRFTARFAPGATRGWLRVEGRYCFSPRRTSVDLPAEEGALELRPELGARIVGRVTMGDAGGPAPPGLEVLLRAEQASVFGGGRRSARLEPDGRFALDALPAGTSGRVFADAPGFASTTERVGALAPGATHALELTLSAAPPARALAIAGTVVWPDGSPAAGALVSAAREGGPEPPAGATRQVRAAADGSFRFDGLDAGSYRLLALEWTDLGAAAAPDEVARAALREVEAGRADCELVLVAGAQVSGRVVDAEDVPLPRFRLVASRGRDDEVVRECDDPLGRFELEGLAQGRWTLRAEAAGYAPLSEPRVELPAGARGLVLRVARTCRVTGVVRAPDGAPAGRARVALSTDPRSAGRPDALRPASARADRDGRFAFEAVAPGRVLVTARAEGFGASRLLELALAPGAAVEGLELSLSAAGRVAGALAPGIEPRARQVVALSSAGTLQDMPTTLEQRQARTDAAGRFAFEDLAPGRYVVALLRDRGGSPPAEDTVGVELAEGGDVEVVIGAPPGPSIALAGRVLEAGAPRAGVSVTADLDAPFRGRRVGTAQSDASGAYALELPEPGRYRLTLALDGEECGDVTIEVPPGARFERDLELGAGRVAGRVFGDAGALAGVAVWLSPAEGLDGERMCATDAEGAFAFERVAAGAWVLHVGGSARPARDRDPAVERYGHRALALALAPGERVEGLAFQLAVSGEIRGRVLRADGSAPPDARVEFTDAAGAPLARWPTREADLTGRFRLRDLDPSTVRLRAVRDGAAGPWVEVGVRSGETAEVVLRL